MPDLTLRDTDRLAYVPVPPHLLPAVYQLLGELTTTPVGGNDSPPADTTGIDPPPVDTTRADLGPFGEGWDAEDFRKLVATEAISTRLVCRFLDLLSPTPGSWYPTSHLLELLGDEHDKVRGGLGAFSRHVRRHYPGLGWPMDAKWGPDLGDGFPLETHYMVTATEAAIWTQVRAGK